MFFLAGGTLCVFAFLYKYSYVSVGTDCVPCPAGTKQPLAGQTGCVPCDKDKGEFQTDAGSTYCKTTKPGYELDNLDTTSKLLSLSWCKI